MALHSMGYICSSVGASFYPQGLTLASNCSQLPGAGRKKPLNIAEFLALLGVGEGLAPPESPRAIQGNQRAGQATALTAAQQDGAAKPPAAGTPLGQGRPGRGNRPSIGPAAQGGLVWWHKQGPQQGSRAEHQLDADPASYPREVPRGERPRRVLVTFARTKVTPSGERPNRAGKPEPWVVRAPVHAGPLPEGDFGPGIARNIAEFLGPLG